MSNIQYTTVVPDLDPSFPAASSIRPIRVLFSGHDFKFIAPLIERLQRNSRYDLRRVEHHGYDVNSEAEAQANADWADVIFCEWALGNAVWNSRHKRPDQLLIVRLHHQEVQTRERTRYIYDIDWSAVDRLILVCPHMFDFMLAEFPILRDGRACLIYNPIDVRGALNRPKLPGAQFNLGLAGMVPRRKRLDLAVETLLELKSHDARFTLYIKGPRPEQYGWMKSRPEELAWYEEIERRIQDSPHAASVVFEPSGANTPRWYSKIGFILSPSDFEGSHQAVAEGMAAGCIPIIRPWDGADRLYPPRYVVGSGREAAAAILKFQDPAVYTAQMEFCRAWAAERFDQLEICERIEAFFTAYAARAHTDLARPGPADDTNPPPPPAVLILGYITPASRGGEYRLRIEQEIRMLSARGCDVHLACLHPEIDPESLAPHFRELEALGCTVHPVPTSHFFDLKLDEDVIRPELDTLDRILDGNGLNVLHAAALYCGRFGLLLKQRRPGLRLIFDAHGAATEEERLSGAHPARVNSLEAWESRALREADLCIFVSGAMNDYFLRKYALPAITHAVVPCALPPERFPGEAHRANLPAPAEGRPTLAFLGAAAPEQCLRETVRLFAQLHRRDPRLLFLMILPRGDHAQARELANEFALAEEDVVAIEALDGQIPAALAAAHAGVLLRRSETIDQVSSPARFGEYLAAGLPLIMSDGIGDFSALAARAGLGLILDGGLLDLPEIPGYELARIAEFVERSRLERRRMAPRCQDLAHEVLHWEVVADGLARALRALPDGNDD